MGQRGVAPANGRVAAFVVLLATAAGSVLGWLIATGADPPARSSWTALVMLGGVLVAAEFLFVRFRYGGEINALNLFEAALMPVLWAYEPIAVVGVVAAAQVVGNILRRNAALKAAFNVAQWSLAAALGAGTILAIDPQPGITPSGLLALIAAMGVVALVNQTCFALVLALANRESLRVVLRGLSGAIVPGWVMGFLLNSAVGALFVLAFHAHWASVVLFPVPLIVLHLAYRGYAGSRSDRMRLAGLHAAAQILAESFDPEQALEPFLREVIGSFEARGASIAIKGPSGIVVRRVSGPGKAMIELRGDTGDSIPEIVLLGRAAGRVTVKEGGPAAAALAEAGFRECLTAPLLQDVAPVGVLMVFDQVGLEGFEDGEIAVLEALARETAGVLSKGRLLTAILEERQRLDEIVSATSDGIFTLDQEGRVRSWNPAMERITGIGAADVIGRAGIFPSLTARTLEGESVDPGRWVNELPPTDFLITAHGRDTRRLSCSFADTGREAGRSRRLIAVVRDATTEDAFRSLRKEFDELTQMQRQQRQVVDQLQRALLPPRPDIDGVQLGIRYRSSESQSPTGGDLFDWKLLPTGEIHVVVVDVLGHGVAATNDAVSVIHTLRTLAVDDCPLERMVERAHEILRAVNPDLVATVLIGRVDPTTGHTRLAGGGHPPALHVGVNGVRQVPAPGGAIGWPHAGSMGLAETVLGPGESLVMYTDGLIEGTRDVLHGEEALMEHARALSSLPAEEIASGLVDRTLGSSEGRDDSLALVLRIPPAVERVTIDLGPGAVDAHRARVEASRWLAAAGVSDEIISDAEIIAGELLANAAVVARAAIRLSLVVEPGSIAVEVEDDGPGDVHLENRGLARAAGDVDAGRGLYIVRSLATSTSFLSSSAGTLVRAVLARSTESGEIRGLRLGTETA